MNDFLKKMFIDEAKPALNRHSGSGGSEEEFDINVGDLVFSDTGITINNDSLKQSLLDENINYISVDVRIALGGESGGIKVLLTSKFQQNNAVIFGGLLIPDVEGTPQNICLTLDTIGEITLKGGIFTLVDVSVVTFAKIVLFK